MTFRACDNKQKLVRDLSADDDDDDEVMLNVLRCQLSDILGTSCDQCRSMVQ